MFPKLKPILITLILLLIIPFIAWSDDFFLEDLDTISYAAIRSVELIWSTNTYTPCQYQGRALPSQGSKVIVEAIVNTSAGDPSNLKYSWFLEDIFQRSKSGYGKDNFYFYAKQRTNAYHVVKVQIFNEDRSVFKEETIKIPIVAPEIVIHPSNGNTHFSEQATEISFVLTDKEFSFIAKPYFFRIKKLTDLEFEWRFAGQEPIAGSAYDANVLDLTISGKGDEEILQKELWVSVTNKKDSKQRASQTIKLQIY